MFFCQLNWSQTPIRTGLSLANYGCYNYRIMGHLHPFLGQDGIVLLFVDFHEKQEVGGDSSLGLTHWDECRE